MFAIVLVALGLALLTSNANGANCAAISQPTNSSVIYLQSNFSSLYQSGTTAILVCRPGYLPKGSTISRCNAQGVWAPLLGTCEPLFSEATCTAISVQNATVSYLQQSPSKPYKSGTLAILQCGLGEVPTGNFTSLCLNGVWTPPLDTCRSLFPDAAKIVRCPTINQISNGRVLYMQGSPFASNAVGSSASLLCDFGYIATGVTRISCDANGRWTDSFGTCQSIIDDPSLNISCPSVAPVLNGTVLYDAIRPRRVGTTAMLMCNIGHVPTGTVSAFCLASGSWSAVLGTCEDPFSPASQCPTLSPDNGFVIYDIFRPRARGTAATLICNIGYVPSGVTLSTCTSSKTWNPTLGTCRSVSGG